MRCPHDTDRENLAKYCNECRAANGDPPYVVVPRRPAEVTDHPSAHERAYPDPSTRPESWQKREQNRLEELHSLPQWAVDIGWEQHKDTGGMVYYYDSTMGEAQWHKPSREQCGLLPE